jgi:hypothetical protein
MTFEGTTPFLKGFYFTLNSRRPYGDDDDWKIAQKGWDNLMFERIKRGLLSSHQLENVDGNPEKDAPDSVTASPRFASNM